MSLKFQRPCLCFFSLFIGINLSLFSQTETVPLWGNHIPNSILNESYIEDPSFENGELIRTTLVSKPTLSIFKPKHSNGTAIVICPGGGYKHLAMNKEGFKVAKWLNTLGITAIVLKYRLPDDRIMSKKSIGPLQDAQEAMRYVRRHAKAWNVDPEKVGILGFSAGGHLASTVSTHFNPEVYESDEASAKPNFSILIYPVISMQDGITHNGSKTNLLGKSPSIDAIQLYSNELQVTSETPPTFLVHATDDKAVPVENSINYYVALKAKKIPVEMHLFEKGGHGFGLSNQATHVHWKTLCEHWLRLHNNIP
ncbi:alpha/beta hydrolase [Formosa haliotis]|uniref:alpha/beta hydrolase n=1 Tax=Formosa haliotis TaxID=1555194 RepID=UPI0008267A21|nr:alpha/beta hydrolase [Formosa haliotis]